ncbi:MAG: response regulator [Pseudanabaenaceae cyanobacterium bins.68]|nr:response regulator [Pseudanabaenaceae cyanobacterium bins.68]
MTTILVVEDNTIVLANLVKLLKLEGFEVLSAANGKLGLEIAQTALPNLIVSDIMMPDLDGYRMLEKLLQNPQTATIPLIFLTAKVERQDMRRAMELGCDDFLTKPFTRDELLGAIRARLEKQAKISDRAQQQLDSLREGITQSLPHRLLFPALQIMSLGDQLRKSADSLTTSQIQTSGDTIYQSGKSLHEMIKRFLLYADLEVIAQDQSRAQQMRSQPSTFMELEIRELAQQLAAKYNRCQDLTLELEDATLAIADHYLEAITKELLDNAFRFSEPDTAVIIQGQITPDRQSYQLQITDHGQGLGAEQIQNLGKYMSFEQKLQSAQGSGLGIAIVKRLAEIHLGSFMIESIPYEFTRVEVALPLFY